MLSNTPSFLDQSTEDLLDTNTSEEFVEGFPSFDDDETPQGDDGSIPESFQTPGQEPRKSISSRYSFMNKKEKAELLFEFAFCLFMQYFSGSYSLADVEFLENENAALYVSICFYALLSTGFTMRSLFKLGPYLFNVLHLESKIKKIDTVFSTLTKEQVNLSDQYDTAEASLYAYLEARDLYIVEEDQPKLDRLQKKEKKKLGIFLSKPKLTFLDYCDMLWNGVIGVCIGRNLNVIANITEGGQSYILPAISGVFFAAINTALFSGIKRNKLFVPSNLMVQYALEQINSTRKVVKKMHVFQSKLKEKQASMSNQIVTLVGKEHKESEVKEVETKESVRQSKARKSSVAALSIDDGSIHAYFSEEERNTPINTVSNIAYALKSLIPLIIGFSSLLIASQAQNNDKKSNNVVLIPLVVSSILSVLLMALRIRRYHSSKVSEFKAYSHFYQSNESSLNQLANELVSSAENIKALDLTFSLVNQAEEGKSTLKPCMPYEKLYQLVHTSYLDRMHHYSIFHSLPYQNRPFSIDRFEDYLDEIKEGSSEANFIKFCTENPKDKMALNNFFVKQANDKAINLKLISGATAVDYEEEKLWVHQNGLSN